MLNYGVVEKKNKGYTYLLLWGRGWSLNSHWIFVGGTEWMPHFNNIVWPSVVVWFSGCWENSDSIATIESNGRSMKDFQIVVKVIHFKRGQYFYTKWLFLSNKVSKWKKYEFLTEQILKYT